MDLVEARLDGSFSLDGEFAREFSIATERVADPIG
jgi:hypothetical protein